MIYLAESGDERERTSFLFKNWYQEPISGIFDTFTCFQLQITQGWRGCCFIFCYFFKTLLSSTLVQQVAF